MGSRVAFLSRCYPCRKISKFFLRGLEEGGYRTIFEDLMNRTCQQRCNRQYCEVVPALGGLRQGVGGDNFVSTALRQTLACGVREDAVGIRDNDGTCASFTQYADRASDGSAGINHVIEQDAVLALNITDHAVGHGLI